LARNRIDLVSADTPGERFIGEEALMERDLTQAEENFERIFNLSPVRMGIIRRRDGMIMAVNDRWIRDTGFTREEAVGHTIFEFDQQLSSELRLRIRQMLKEGESIRDLEGRVWTKAGEERLIVASTEGVEFENEPSFLWASDDITERKQAEEQNRRLIYELGERVKELTLLHQTARLIQNEEKSVPDLLREVVALIPPAWQYPEDTAARVSFGDLEFKTPNFARTQWSQTADLRAAETTGVIEVYCLEQRPDADVGPFLFEERTLIDSLAEMLSSALARRASREQLRALSRRVQSAREEEGARIAREIHDVLGASLTGLKWDLEAISKALSKTENGDDVETVRHRIPIMSKQIDSTIDVVRRISSELRPSILDDLGLAAAIEWQSQQFQQRTGIDCQCESIYDPEDLGREQATAVFRIFQEVLTNVLRHSKATLVVVEMSANDDVFSLRVDDNGRGITQAEVNNPASLGLLGMRERAHLIGGEVSVKGEDGKGTTVIVRVPIN
jgi:PAS domain S-box-containing protein